MQTPPSPSPGGETRGPDSATSPSGGNNRPPSRLLAPLAPAHMMQQRFFPAPLWFENSNAPAGVTIAARRVLGDMPLAEPPPRPECEIRGAPMSFLSHVTAMVLTYNEEPNIERTLEALRLVGEVLVVDSGSIDATAAIVARFPNARVVVRKFDTAADQCNFGLTHVSTPWVLSLDADYELSAALIQELAALTPPENVAGYTASFVYRIFGKPLSASLYPERTVLYRRRVAHYRNEGHTQRVTIDGTIEHLAAPIFHDDRKSLARWFSSQSAYARREADYLLSKPREQLRRVDRLRLLAWPAPLLVFFYTLLWKRCLFDGWAGWSYVLQRTFAEIALALELVDRRLRRETAPREAAHT